MFIEINVYIYNLITFHFSHVLYAHVNVCNNFKCAVIDNSIFILKLLKKT